MISEFLKIKSFLYLKYNLNNLDFWKCRSRTYVKIWNERRTFCKSCVEEP